MNQSQEAGNNNHDCDVGRGSKWRKKSRVVRKSSFERVPKGFFSVIRILTVDFILPNSQTLTLNCLGNRTVAQIKQQVLVRKLTSPEIYVIRKYNCLDYYRLIDWTTVKQDLLTVIVTFRNMFTFSYTHNHFRCDGLKLLSSSQPL